MRAELLVTGGSGKLGRELVKVWPDSIHPTHGELDVSDGSSVNRFIRKNKPRTLVHCAALTSVRQCETKRESAWQTNVIGTENLVKEIEEYSEDCYFVYVSTACVFHGDLGNYVETDIPYPKNFYSFTKAQAEGVVKYSKLKNWMIIRTNFVGRERWPYERAFTDRFGTYLFADDAARAIKQVVSQRLTGVIHVCGGKTMSMFELAKITTPNIQPMTIVEYSGPPLTMNMSLKSTRIRPFKLTT